MRSVSPAGMESTSSTLYVSPLAAKKVLASSRDQNSFVNGLLRLMMSRMRASILGRSSGMNGSALSKSYQKPFSMTGPMVTCVPGHSSCTASASTCALSCRINSSASGSSREMNLMPALAVIGSAMSASLPSSAMATVRLASDLAMLSATSLPVVPDLKGRLLPSGNVRVMSADMSVSSHSLPTNAGKMGSGALSGVTPGPGSKQALF